MSELTKPELIYAPFTPEQVRNLNLMQACRHMHPFTCGNRGDGNHDRHDNDLGSLVATVRGWICVYCDYTQDWAHEFMADPEALKGMNQFYMRLRQERIAAESKQPVPTRQHSQRAEDAVKP